MGDERPQAGDPIRVVSPCIAAEDPARCEFRCRCRYPKCKCGHEGEVAYCVRHADAILAHRAKPTHKQHELARSAHHPFDG